MVVLISVNELLVRLAMPPPLTAELPFYGDTLQAQSTVVENASAIAAGHTVGDG
jgi:hypothetical protein